MICSWLQDKVGAIRFSDLLRCLYPEASTLDLRLLARMARPDVSVLGCASLSMCKPKPSLFDAWGASVFVAVLACLVSHLLLQACAGMGLPLLHTTILHVYLYTYMQLHVLGDALCLQPQCPTHANRGKGAETESLHNSEKEDSHTHATTPNAAKQPHPPPQETHDNAGKYVPGIPRDSTMIVKAHAEIRTQVARIRIWSDNHYTTRASPYDKEVGDVSPRCSWLSQHACKDNKPAYPISCLCFSSHKH
eukprot:743558-Pelagomonas_calceolata.AAC.2